MKYRRLTYCFHRLLRDLDSGATEIARRMLLHEVSGTQAETLLRVLSALPDDYLGRSLSPFEVRALREHISASLHSLAASRAMVLCPLAKCVPCPSAEGRELKTGRKS